MSDIVDRLRDRAAASLGVSRSNITDLQELCRDAAGEIGRLRERVETLLATQDLAARDCVRLREAIGYISRMHLLPDDKANRATLVAARRVASGALKPTP